MGDDALLALIGFTEATERVPCIAQLRQIFPKKGDLLISYLAANYEGRDTLVIETESPCSKQEFIALMRELDNMGVLPPKNLRTPGATIIIEMPWSSACKLVTKYHNGSISLAAYRGGKLISETPDGNK